MLDERLLEWATPTQARYLKATNEAGGVRAAERKLNLSTDAVGQSIRALKAHAARKGYSPEHDMIHPVPDGFKLARHSQYYGSEGEPRGRWVVASPDAERQAQLIREAIRAFVEEAPPIIAPIGPTDPDHDIIPWIQIGDSHLGMLAHEAETGENFDLKIAERETCAAIQQIIADVGPHERCVINDLGDFTHYENMSGTTEASGHALDFDGRFPKMIRAYSKIMRFIVDTALAQFKHVDVIVNQGNHSRTNDLWMAELLRATYGPSGRVHVLNNDNAFIAYRMGATFVMTHHSDKCKPHRLAQVMATDYPKDWGESEFRMIDIGHIHHGMVLKEHPGVVIESFNQLAPKDKWAHDAGYRSRSSITAILRSRTYGEVGRKVLPIKQVRDRIVAASRGSGVEYTPSQKVAYSV